MAIYVHDCSPWTNCSQLQQTGEQTVKQGEQLWKKFKQSWTVMKGTIYLNKYSKITISLQTDTINIPKKNHNGGNQMVKRWPCHYSTTNNNMKTKPISLQQVSHCEHRYQTLVVISLTQLLQKPTWTQIQSPSPVSLSQHIMNKIT